MAEKSEFFDKLFTTDMQEKNKNEATLQNIHSAVLEEVIKFIYTGKADILDSTKAKELLDAAEQFGIEGLKSICEQELLKALTKENALEMLKTADMFNAKVLEHESLEFIIK